MRRLLLLALLASCGTSKNEARQPSSLDCGISDRTALDGRGLGLLAVGESVDAIRARCHIVEDTVTLGDEGKPVRVIRVDLARDTVEAVIVDGRIWRIEVSSAAFKTRDSVGVGTLVGRLLRHQDVHGREGEGALYLTTVSQCGLSFRASYVPGDTEHRAEWTYADVSRLPDTTRVEKVLVIGCTSLEQ